MENQTTPTPAAPQPTVYLEEKKSLLELLKELFEKLLKRIDKKLNKYELKTLDNRMQQIEKDIDALESASDVNLNALRDVVNYAQSIHDNIENTTAEDIDKLLSNFHKDLQAPRETIMDKAGESFEFTGKLNEVIRAKFGKELDDKSDAFIENMPIYTSGNNKYIGFKDKKEFKVAKLTIERDSDNKKMIFVNEVEDGNKIKGLKELDNEETKNLSLEERAAFAVHGITEKGTEALEAKQNYDSFQIFKKQFSIPTGKETATARYCKEDNTFRIYDFKTKNMIVFKPEQVKEGMEINVYALRIENPFPLDNSVPVIDLTDKNIKPIASYKGTSTNTIISKNPNMPRASAKLLNSAPANAYLKHFGVDNASIAQRDKELQEDMKAKAISADGFKSQREGARQLGKAISQKFRDNGIPCEVSTDKAIILDFQNGLKAKINLEKNGIPFNIDYSAINRTGEKETVTSYADGCRFSGNFTGQNRKKFEAVHDLLTQEIVDKVQAYQTDISLSGQNIEEAESIKDQIDDSGLVSVEIDRS